jgi:transcriptional regulator with XRE-family HTH domain
MPPNGHKASLLTNTPIHNLQTQLGRQIESYRLARNLRQQDVAQAAGLGLSSITRLEQGKGATLETLIRVLRALGCEDRLGLLLPDATLSPLDPASAKGSARQRARPDTAPAKPWTWDAP